ncbi:MAG: hypothetical protein KDA37_18315 [Planctomycetales bacterium]|nr:hypothetical protein [Planctomycetales bacterium]
MKDSQKTPRITRSRLVFEQLEDKRVLATLTVSSDSDSGVVDPDDGIVTLREAIQYVNKDYLLTGVEADAQTFSYLDLGTNDKIVFANGISSIQLSYNEALIIKNSVVIAGPGWDQLTIDASMLPNNSDSVYGNGKQVFGIEITTDEAVTIRDLAITGGDAGEGCGIGTRNLAPDLGTSVTLERLHVYGNQAKNAGGGIYSALAISPL